MSLRLTIKALRPGGEPPLEFAVDIESAATVEELKQRIAGRVELPQENIRLVCAGRIWESSCTIGSYGVTADSVVHCLNNPPRQAVPAAQQTLQAVDPLQHMMGGAALPSSSAQSGDPMQQMMAQAQRQMMRNPEVMQQIMGSPMVQQMLSNPETVRAMARMNPQLNQLMEQRPEIARLFEDPEMLQQSMRMIANPALMREMTRNADRAIGQLDAMPGGHSALRRAHEEYADPLFDAISGRGDGGGEGVGTTASYEQPTVGPPNSEALPNPWGPPPSTAPSAMQGAVAAPAATPASGAAATARGEAPAPSGLGLAAGTPSGMSTPAMGGGFAGAAPPGNPMLQQMMGDPARMQQMMAAAQQLRQLTAAGATSGGAGGLGTPAAPFAAGATTPTATGAGATGSGGGASNNPLSTAMQRSAQRLRFAPQLRQLEAMGFADEGACLQALLQHDGRLDAALDALLSGAPPGGGAGEGAA